MVHENAIIDIERRHPDYIKMRPLWDFYSDSYKGGSDYVKPFSAGSPEELSYLYPHDSEKLIKGKYADRHAKSFFANYCRLPVNTYTKYIFSNKEPIDREYEGDSYTPYIGNADLQGSSMDLIMKRFTVNMLVYGQAYLIVDKMPIPQGIISVAQEREVNSRAYVQHLPTENVIDWSIDVRTGLYRWVLIKQEYVDDNDFSSDRCYSTIYYLWTPTHFITLNDKGCMHVIDGVDQIVEHNLGFVPLVVGKYTDVDLDGKPESMLADIAEINREIYNVYSMYQEELYKIAFAMLMKPKADDSFDESLDLAGQVEYVSSNLVMEYSASGSAPSYLAPPVQALVEKRAYINELIMKIMQIANLGDKAGVTNYQSGLAMSFAYSDTYYTVSQLAQKIQTSEEHVWRIFRLYDSSNLTGDIDVCYPDDFDSQSDQQKNDTFTLIHDKLDGSPTAQALSDLRLARDNIQMTRDQDNKVEKELTVFYDKKSLNALADDESMQAMNNTLLNEGRQDVEPSSVTSNIDLSPEGE